MQNQEKMQTEQQALLALSQVEDLAEKKMKIYARLLTDAALAKDMEMLAMRHAKRKTLLQSLANEKDKKCEKRKKEVGMDEMNAQEREQ